MTGLRNDTSASDTAEQVECQVGRRAEYTQVGDWVLLAPIRAAAKALYWALSAHVNSGRNDTQVWPTLDMLAEIMGLSRGDKVKTYVDELVAIDAVNVAKTRYAGGLRERSVYTVHQSPPPGYGGLVSLKAFYLARRARIEAAQSGSPQVVPAPPNEGAGKQAQKPQVSPAPPRRGAAAPRNQGAAAPPIRGCNQTKGNEMKNNQPGPGTPAAGHSGAAATGWLDEQPQPEAQAPAAPTPGVRFLASLPASCRPDQHAVARLAPKVERLLASDEWTPDSLRRRLTAGIESAHSPAGALVRRLEGLALPKGAEPGRPAWCGECDSHTRQRENAQGLPYRCPKCHPLAVGA